MPRLENWRIELHEGRSGFYYRLTGICFGHPNHPTILNGEPVFTSKLKSIDFVNQKAETENTVYKLGEKADA